MDEYRHHVSGFFLQREKADRTRDELLEQGLSLEQLQVYTADSAPPAPEPTRDSDEVLKDVLVDGAIGTAVGTGVWGLATIGMAAANISLFIASPLIGPLTMLGWGAGLGGLLGAAVGAAENANPKGTFSDLVLDAIRHGHAVLVVETRSLEQTRVARQTIEAAVGEYKEFDIKVT